MDSRLMAGIGGGVDSGAYTDLNRLNQLKVGKERDSEGNFRLPLAMPRKPMEEIASKKRAEYRRRFTLLDSLIDQVNQATRR